MRTRTHARLLLLLSLALAVTLAAAGCGASPPDPDVATETPIAANPGSSGGAGDAGDAGDAGNANTGDAATSAPSGGGAEAADPADTGLPEDLPVLAGAEKLSAAADGSYVRYEASVTPGEAQAFYQEQLEAAGWTLLSKQDPKPSDNVTLLRTKDKRNLSITIQGVAGQEGRVRVLMTIIPK